MFFLIEVSVEPFFSIHLSPRYKSYSSPSFPTEVSIEPFFFLHHSDSSRYETVSSPCIPTEVSIEPFFATHISDYSGYESDFSPCFPTKVKVESLSDIHFFWFIRLIRLIRFMSVIYNNPSSHLVSCTLESSYSLLINLIETVIITFSCFQTYFKFDLYSSFLCFIIKLSIFTVIADVHTFYLWCFLLPSKRKNLEDVNDQEDEESKHDDHDGLAMNWWGHEAIVVGDIHGGIYRKLVWLRN